MIRSQEIQALLAGSRRTSQHWPERVWVFLSLLLTDTAAFGIGFLIAYLVRFEADLSFFYDNVSSVASQYTELINLLVPVWVVVFAVFRLYDVRLLFGGLEEYARVFNACTTGVMLVMVGSFLLPDMVIARGWLLLSWFSVTATAEVGRFAVRRTVYHLRSQGHLFNAMLIVGADEEGRAVAEQLVSNPTAGVRLLGFVDDELAPGTEVLPGLRVLGSTAATPRLVRQLGVHELTISSSALSRSKLLDIFQTFGNSDEVNVRLSSGLFEIMTTGLHVKNIGHVPLLSVNRVRLTGADVVLKTLLDYVGATVGLILLAPLFVLIGIAIKLSSPGPVFHRRRVMGVGGKKFDAFKFRTMIPNADEVLEQNPELMREYEKNFKLRDDPRVTAIGRLLRKTSVDELPQLINVLRGEMSLVGPRMIVEEEMEKYGKWGMNLLTVKPGITGLWQIGGRSEVDYDGRVRLDMHYIRNYTIWFDLQILFRTLPAVLRQKGAY